MLFNLQTKFPQSVGSTVRCEKFLCARLGPDIVVDNVAWTPVLFKHEEDPTFFKAYLLEEVPLVAGFLN